MFKIYFKAACRNLIKNKIYSVINISGLAVGLASFIIILLYLNYELSYDKWDPSLKKVYKISQRTNEDILEQTPAPLGRFLKETIPAIEASTTIAASGSYKVLLSTGEKKIYQEGCVEADSSFLKVFPYKITNGDAATALNKPNAVVISEEVALKLFGHVDVIGKTIKIFNAFDCEVTAVMQQPDKPSHLNTKIVYRSPNEKANMSWQNNSFQTYVSTKKYVPAFQLEANVDQLFYDSRLKQGNQSLAEFRAAGHRAGLFAEEAGKLHNFPRYGNSNFSTVNVLLLLAALLLLAGAINFSNLTIAASIRRAKEVGIRKVLGSTGKQMFSQFIFEVALQCFASLCLALFLFHLILPYFNSEFNINLKFFQPGNELSIFTQIILCLLIVIILSGLYPAVFLSKYNITKVLKGDYSRGSGGATFRSSLIVVQFVVAAFFVIGTLVINTQMKYMQTKNKHFSGEQVMRIEAPQKIRDGGFDVAKQLLSGVQGVEYVSKTTAVPGDAIADTSTVAFKYSTKEFRMNSVKISTDYFKTLGIGILQGRPFDNSYSDQNTRSAIINETAARTLNLSQPVGTSISFAFCDSVPLQIIAVVKDFNVTGFENTVQPVVFTIGNKACMFQSGGGLLLKINSANIHQSIAGIEKAWKQIEPDFPIRYSFLDENFEQLFSSYARLQKIISFFCITAIIISIMGLFALTAFSISQRTKEIGIRKILGAGFADLGLLFSKDFLRLIVIAVVIAIPLGWWAANEWLQTFAYRIDLNWWMFILAALIVVTVSTITIGIQIMKATIANPVKSLRTD